MKALKIDGPFDPVVKALIKKHEEVAFKAGYHQGVEDFVECAKYIEKGRREVVEWLAAHPYYSKMFGESPFEWQAKLKSWNISV